MGVYAKMRVSLRMELKDQKNTDFIALFFVFVVSDSPCFIFFIVFLTSLA